MLYLTVYQTERGTLDRYTKWRPTYEVGEVNSFGWTVLAIYRLYYGSFKTLNTIYLDISKRKCRKNKLKKIIETLKEK